VLLIRFLVFLEALLSGVLLNDVLLFVKLPNAHSALMLIWRLYLAREEHEQGSVIGKRTLWV
jgi:hypothetical protein